MKINKLLMVGMVIGAYWLGKTKGARLGAKAVMDTYADNIPEDTFTIKILDNAVCTLTATAKKGK